MTIYTILALIFGALVLFGAWKLGTFGLETKDGVTKKKDSK